MARGELERNGRIEAADEQMNDSTLIAYLHMKKFFPGARFRKAARCSRNSETEKYRL